MTAPPASDPVIAQPHMPQISFDGHNSQPAPIIVPEAATRRQQEGHAFIRTLKEQPLRPPKVYPEFRVPPLSRTHVLGAIKAKPKEERGSFEDARKRLDRLDVFQTVRDTTDARLSAQD